MKCPKCGHENWEGAGFCGGCGQSLTAERTCPQCGHANPQGNRFCDKCGRALVEPAPPPASPSPQPTSFAGGRYQVKKFLGDLLTYRYPRSAGLSAVHAVQASLELLKFLRNYNTKNTTAEEQRISVRIAIHFGQVDVAENDREGPEVSYAFRLESINRGSLRDGINAVTPDELPLHD